MELLGVVVERNVPWAESCMIELLGDMFNQNEPTLTILVLLGPVGDAGWHCDHILGWIMHG